LLYRNEKNMKNWKNIEVSQNKKKVNGKFMWILSYTLEGVLIGKTNHSVKQSRLDQLAFNFCLENNMSNLIHPSTF
jgi:hypothetical protein